LFGMSALVFGTAILIVFFAVDGEIDAVAAMWFGRPYGNPGAPIQATISLTVLTAIIPVAAAIRTLRGMISESRDPLKKPTVPTRQRPPRVIVRVRPQQLPRWARRT
jgi:hypothetical protein